VSDRESLNITLLAATGAAGIALLAAGVLRRSWA